MEKPNRAERRKSKFGGGRATEHGGWPTVRPNPALQVETAGEGAADEPAAAKPDAGDEPTPAEKDSKEG